MVEHFEFMLLATTSSTSSLGNHLFRGTNMVVLFCFTLKSPFMPWLHCFTHVGGAQTVCERYMLHLLWQQWWLLGCSFCSISLFCGKKSMRKLQKSIYNLHRKQYFFCYLFLVLQQKNM